jgi:hypothetical protein
MPKLNRTYLYSAAYPNGFLHEGLTDGEEAALLEEGWFDHPSKVPGAPESAKNMTGGPRVAPRPSRRSSIRQTIFVPCSSAART